MSRADSQVEPQAESQAYRDAIAAQQTASDPNASVFVDANAGAGKTSVLTARVARLLLAGAAPSKILCITYTKAAAAEMADRLLSLLGDWALADDATLSGALSRVEGPAARARDADALARARGLFARALETPGGLKIQTIHSFCESVLRRFPLETGSAPGFTVIDEKEALALIGSALAGVHARADDDAEIGAALQRLTGAMEPDRLRDLFIGETISRQKIGDALGAAGGWEALRAASAQRFGIASGETAASIRDAFMASVGAAEIVRLERALRDGGKNSREAADALASFLATTGSDARIEFLRKAFLIDSGAAKAKFPDKPVKSAHPWAEGYCRELTQRLLEAEERATAADNGADTIAFLTLLEEVSTAYRRFKQARAGLDYDDLIARARALFSGGAGSAWVRYKLDQGVDHILLDEGQDTSPEQWRVIEGPLEEFFAGAGARSERRTFFAVGDKKQSIYSFQGADAELFADKELALGKKIAAVQTFRNVPLRLSFRSAAPILDFVDALFADKEVLDGVGADWPLRHELCRLGEAGAVELWPLAAKGEAEKPRAWDAPLDAVAEDNPRRRLAIAIARDLKRRIGSEILPSHGRPLKAGDFLVLVQSRAALFHETIRALARAGVPVAGADRIRLLEEPAVDDVLSFARAVLLYSDDLSLAEALRSPFFRIDEASLYDLAQPREAGTPLRTELRRRAGEIAEWAEAEAALVRAERIGRDEGAFAFISHLLEEGEPSGRKRLYSRLSPSAAEPLNELLRQALDYERRHPRSLQGFVNWADVNADEIKRDPDQAGDCVRVMTVHGAKGLEANVVILLDAHRGPKLSLGPLFYEGPRGRLAPILSTSAKRESAPAQAARAVQRRRAYEEYRRLLYVAATRARDRLIVCGVEHGNTKDPHKKPPAEKSWHALAEDAFARLDPRDDREAPWGGMIRIVECAQQIAPSDKKTAAAAPATGAPPSWLKAPAAPERRRRLTPSALGAESAAPAYSPMRARLARGKALHRLIELLPRAEDSRRAALADRLLLRHAPGVAADERARWREEALAVVRDPAFAPVFGPSSRAEVAVAGTLRTAGGETFVSGQIDRLAFDSERLLIVDYKTNRPPPKSVDDAPEAYLAQLAAYRSLLRDLYPDARIEAALLWTYEARLMPLPDALLDIALARFVGAT